YAGGFSLSSTRLHELEPALIQSAEEGVEETEEERILDAHISLEEITNELRKSISVFEPWGMGNDQPSFMLPAVNVSSVEMFGRNQEHLKLKLDRGLEAVAFFKALSSYGIDNTINSTIDLIAHIE